MTTNRKIFIERKLSNITYQLAGVLGILTLTLPVVIMFTMWLVAAGKCGEWVMWIAAADMIAVVLLLFVDGVIHIVDKYFEQSIARDIKNTEAYKNANK